MIHPSADVQSQHIGEGTQVWQFAIILPNAVIGKNCNINCHTFIENDVVLGDRVTIKAGVYLWDGLTIGDDVFIGPNATFINDKYPRSKKYPEKFERTEIENGVSIGANATIVGPVKLGSYALVGAGSVVTKDVDAFTLVVGNPAKAVGKVDRNGRIIKSKAND
jgi:UDP-2-acetamido-3-amino-2,3-dideoxy-glucuronate N-acetyltransferase